MSYYVTIDLNTPSQGIDSLEYNVNAYNDAKLIIEDLDKGSIESVLVESEFRNLQTTGKTEEWKACKKHCSIKAFSYLRPHERK